MVLLDTDTCIHLSRGNGGVLKALELKASADVYVSILSIYEMEYGIQKGTLQRANKRQALEDLKKFFNIIPLGEAEIKEAASIRANLEKEGRPIGSIDYLIAGTAKANKLKVITGNQKEFGRVKGLKTEDWITR